jgi:hypothetical protein
MSKETYVNISRLEIAVTTPKQQLNPCAPCELNPVNCGKQRVIKVYGTDGAWCIWKGEIKRVAPPLSGNGVVTA